MAGFKIAAFRGERPLVSNRLLEPNEAQLARNVKLGSGELRPFRDTAFAGTLARPGTNTTIYKFGSGPASRWLHWTSDVDVVRGPVAGDTTERTYFTGTDVPRVTNANMVDVGGNDQYPESSYKLGVPGPTLAPVAAVTTKLSQGRVTQPLTTPTLQARFTAFPPNYAGPIFTSPYKSTIEPSDGTGDTVQFEMATGTELSVTVVDANNIKLSAASGDPGFAPTQFLSGWRVGELTTTADQAVSAQLRIPNGVAANVPGHGLRTGDIIKVTSVETPMTWTTTTSLTINQSAQNNVTPSSGTVSIAGIWTYVVSSRENEVDLQVRTYVYTWVSTLGEESAPSPPSAELECAPTDGIEVSSFGAPPSDEVVVTKMRLYRTSTGTDQTAFQFVKELALPVTTITDDVADEALGEVLQTEAWLPPPSGLKGICSLPNGIFAGFVGNTLYLSEPGYPHAWPAEYKQATDYPIVGLCPFGSSLLVATEGVPYVGQGTHPRNFKLRRIEFAQGCVSKRSIKNIGEAVIYASPDGLVSVSNTQVALITENGIFDHDTWQQYNPSSIHAYNYNGLYLAFFSGGAQGSGALLFDPFNPNVGLSRTDQSFLAGYVDLRDDTLYLTNGSSVTKWEGGSGYLTMLYRSKNFELEAPNNFGWLRVVANNYPLTLRFYGDGVLRDTKTITSRDAVRLSSGQMYDTCFVEIEGTVSALKVMVGDDPKDVMEG